MLVGIVEPGERVLDRRAAIAGRRAERLAAANGEILYSAPTRTEVRGHAHATERMAQIGIAVVLRQVEASRGLAQHQLEVGVVAQLDAPAPVGAVAAGRRELGGAAKDGTLPAPISVERYTNG